MYVCMTEVRQNPTRRQLRWSDTDRIATNELLLGQDPPEMDGDIDSAFQQIDESIRQCIERTKIDSPTREITQHTDRWKILAEKDDPKAIWRAIGWNGSVVHENTCDDRPRDSEFKVHFEHLLAPLGIEPLDPLVAQGSPYIPVTDDPFTPLEIKNAIATMKSNRSGGPSGIPPGVLKALPANWIVYLAVVLSNILATARLPVSWSRSRMVVLFKKGCRHLCDNYRGISIMDTFAKLFDLLLCKRLELWFQPDREQAGAQRGRGCMEHIVSLRLLIDYAISKKVKLFIVLVDFSKAYDKVPRDALIRLLRQLGCGYAMILALCCMYTDTKLILGTAIITATVGLRQGSPTSCLLFTLYVNDLVRKLKHVCGHDGFLTWIHCLLLMDDTVLLATTRGKCIKKMDILREFCDESGMVVNPSKTKFMVINGVSGDKAPLVSRDLTVENCDSYTYLGAVFTQDGSVKASVKEHVIVKQAHLMKFVAFVTKNADFPFWVKRKVLDAALLSSVLYSCESWLGTSVKAAQSMYYTAVKALLAVRVSTPNDLCLAELGYPALGARVKATQRKFIASMLDKRRGLTDDPFVSIWNICCAAQTRGAKYLQSVMARNDHLEVDIRQRKHVINMSDRTKFRTYANTNSETSVHPMYTNVSVTINEHDRIAASRLRLSSHSLAIETGRWSRVARERRLCSCGEVQTEEHVVCHCPRTIHVRERHPNLNFTDIGSFFDNTDISSVCRVSSLVLKEFMR